MRTVDHDAVIQEILNNETAYGNTENAAILANQTILLMGGWDDAIAPIETVVLAFYRALQRRPESDVTIVAYQDDHSFSDHLAEIAENILAWL